MSLRVELVTGRMNKSYINDMTLTWEDTQTTGTVFALRNLGESYVFMK